MICQCPCGCRRRLRGPITQLFARCRRCVHPYIPDVGPTTIGRLQTHLDRRAARPPAGRPF